MGDMFEVVGEAIYDGDTDRLIPVETEELLDRKTYWGGMEAAFWWGFMWAHGIDHLDDDTAEDAAESFERFQARWAGYEEEYLEAQRRKPCPGTYRTLYPALGITKCDLCGDESNSEPGLKCGRVDDE